MVSRWGYPIILLWGCVVEDVTLFKGIEGSTWTSPCSSLVSGIGEVRKCSAFAKGSVAYVAWVPWEGQPS